MEMTLLEQDMQQFHYGETVTKNEVKSAYEILSKVITEDLVKERIQFSLNYVLASFKENKPINIRFVEQDIPIFERLYELIPQDERKVVAKVCKWLGAERLCRVYISYASSDAENPRIDDIEKRLEEHFKLWNIPFEVYTNTNEKKISNFEKNIGKAKIVIVILSDKYFRSSHCMNEWTLIHIDTRGKTIVYVKYDQEKIKLNSKKVLNNGFDFDEPKYRKSIDEH